MEKNTVAFMYDFDETLGKGYMQDHSLVPLMGFAADKFWQAVNEFGKENNMDNVLAYLYKIMQYSKEKGLNITKEKMFELAEGITYFDGVLEWFDRINEFGRSLGIKIEHYIISSGMREIIEGTEIAKHFKYIFACSYIYDEQGNPIWPCIAVNYTNKTQYLFRIRKNQMEDLNNSVGINEYIDEENKLSYKKMFYFGDGMTDVPCMKLLKQKGGNSFAVFNRESQRAKEIAINLYKDGRVNYFAAADYTNGSKLDKIVKALLVKISEDDKIEKSLKLDN